MSVVYLILNIIVLFMLLVARFAGVQHVWEGLKTAFLYTFGGIVMVTLLYLILGF